MTSGGVFAVTWVVPWLRLMEVWIAAKAIHEIKTKPAMDAARLRQEVIGWDSS